MITAIILNKQHQISDTITSLLDFKINQIIVGTYQPFTSKYAKVINLQYGDSANKLITHATDDYILYIKDNEVLLQFEVGLEAEVYGVQILNDDILLKEPRLWNKKLNLSFKNPVFEKLDAEITQMSEVLIYQNNTKDDPTDLLAKWHKTSPFSLDCYYYKAFNALANKNLKEFKSLITYYLFNSKKEDISSTMARYYLAIIQGLVDNEVEEAIQNVVLCLANYPLMAEFWCVLGDIFIKSNKYDKAIEFYKNSIILGSRRLKTDLWPMQLSKYQEYPAEMIDKCQKILETSRKLTITVT